MEKEIKDLFKLKSFSCQNNLIEKKKYPFHLFRAYKKMQNFMNKYHYFRIEECEDCKIEQMIVSGECDKPPFRVIKHTKIKNGCCTQGCSMNYVGVVNTIRTGPERRLWLFCSDSHYDPIIHSRMTRMRTHWAAQFDRDSIYTTYWGDCETPRRGNNKIYSIEDAKKELETRSTITQTHIVYNYCINHKSDNIKSKEEVKVDNKQMQYFNRKYAEIRRLIYPPTEKFVMNKDDFPSLT